MSIQQQTLMHYDPATGRDHPYPSHAQQWREFHGKAAWLFNPWTGGMRSALDIGGDTFGHLIVPPGEPIHAAQPTMEQPCAAAKLPLPPYDLCTYCGKTGDEPCSQFIPQVTASKQCENFRTRLKGGT